MREEAERSRYRPAEGKPQELVGVAHTSSHQARCICPRPALDQTCQSFSMGQEGAPESKLGAVEG